MSHVEDHEGHGHSVAAWVSTAVMLVASAAACYGMVRANTGLMVTGAVVFVLGVPLLLVGVATDWAPLLFVGAFWVVSWLEVLGTLGYGDKTPPRSLYS